MECYSAINEKEILPFAITWMKLEGVILIDKSQIKKNLLFYLICGILKKKGIHRYIIDWWSSGVE